MNLLKEVLTHEVYPALGCTEPVSCAYAAAVAAAQLGEPVESLTLRTDPGTYKNGAAVTVPFSQGAKGNLIAAALGAVLANPEAKLELLRDATPAVLQKAKALCDGECCRSECLAGENDFRVQVDLTGREHTARSVLAGGHTNVVSIEKNGKTVFGDDLSTDDPRRDGHGALAYRGLLQRMDVLGVLSLSDGLDEKDRVFLREGVRMNLLMAKRGLEVGLTASRLLQMKRDGYLAEDMFFRAKLRVASAVDPRMAGVAEPVMTSGGSGNQGIVAILTVYSAANEMGLDEEDMLRGLAAAHLLNAYVKCFVGELSVICGCAIAAGIAAAAAIVYLKTGADDEKIALAVNNVIGDLGGLICDGAKPGCAMKAITAVDTALRSALMALEGYGVSGDDGMAGRTAEDSIRNLGRITLEGMFPVDPTVLEILLEKASTAGRA